jgi:hypothetical protein
MQSITQIVMDMTAIERNPSLTHGRRYSMIMDHLHVIKNETSHFHHILNNSEKIPEDSRNIIKTYLATLRGFVFQVDREVEESEKELCEVLRAAKNIDMAGDQKLGGGVVTKKDVQELIEKEKKVEAEFLEYVSTISIQDLTTKQDAVLRQYLETNSNYKLLATSKLASTLFIPYDIKDRYPEEYEYHSQVFVEQLSEFHTLVHKSVEHFQSIEIGKLSKDFQNFKRNDLTYGGKINSGLIVVLDDGIKFFASVGFRNSLKTLEKRFNTVSKKVDSLGKEYLKYAKSVKKIAELSMELAEDIKSSEVVRLNSAITRELFAVENKPYYEMLYEEVAKKHIFSKFPQEEQGVAKPKPTVNSSALFNL